MVHLCVGLVLHGDSPHVMEVLTALKNQDLDDGTNISLVVVDNVTPETVRAEIFESFGGSLLLLKNRENLGFSAAVNQCFAEAERYGANYLLLLNPDVLLDALAVRELLRCAQSSPQIAMVTPKLLRANPDLSPTEPARLDACGMMMTNQLRHFDRGSNELDLGQFDKQEEVFGGTGACLLIKLSEVKDLLLPRSEHDSSMWKIYPQLEHGVQDRPQLLDEAFFAYREDADLAWRAQIRAKKIIYCPTAIGHHVRRVTPDVRSNLPPAINLWSVRNRFLLQINNLRLLALPRVIFPGFIVRNGLVLLAALLKERSSLPAFVQIIGLLPRALFQRKLIQRSVTLKAYRANLGRWFSP